VRQLLTARVATPLTVGVIALALVLPALLALMVENSRSVAHSLEAGRDISVYLHMPLSDGDGRRVTERIGARADVVSAQYVSPDDGLREFRQWSGLGTAIDALGRNPLPGAIIVRPRASPTDSSAIDHLAAELRAMPDVAHVEVNSAWIRRYASLVATVTRVAIVLGLLWSGSVLLIVGNTIRLLVDAERADVEVLTLIGATDAYIRRPYLYAGTGYGLLGGLLAGAVLAALVLVFRAPVSEIAAAYGSTYTLQLPSGSLLAALIVGGAGLGWLAAYASATRQCRVVWPRPGRDR
jgi:cell division transport system permease protein